MQNHDVTKIALDKAIEAWRHNPEGNGVAPALVAFLRAAADVHAGCYQHLDPRDTLKLLALRVEILHELID